MKVLKKVCLSRFTLILITTPLFIHFLACERKQSQPPEKPDYSSISDSLLQAEASQILFLADNVSADSARKQLTKFSFDSLSSFRAQAKYYYLNGYVLDYEGEFKASIEEYKRGIQLLEDRQDFSNKDLALLYNDLAYVYGELNIQPLERVNCERAFEYISTYHSNDLDNYASIYMNYMQTVSEYGDKSKATQLRESAKIHLNGVKEPLYQFRFFRAEGAYLNNFPNKEEIEELNAQLTSYINQLPDSVQKAFSNYAFYTFDALGYGLLELKDYEGAKNIFDQMKKRANNDLNIMKAESNLAAYYLQRKEYLKASEAYSRSFDLLKAGPNKVNGMMLQAAGSHMLSRAGLEEQAERVSEEMWESYFNEDLSTEILEKSRFQENSNRWLYILASSAEVFRRNYEKSGKENDLYLAGLFAEKAAQMFEGYYSRGFFHEDLEENFNSISEELLHFLYLANPDHPKTESILSLIENNQSAYVWNKFLLRQFDQNDSAFNDFSELQYELSLAETDLDRRHLWQRKFDLLEDFNPVWASFVSKQVNLSELRKELSSDQCLIRYLMSENEVWAYVLTKKEIKTFHLGERAEIEKLTNDYFFAVSQRKESHGEIGDLLYQTLLKPLSVDSGELIIIPDEVISQLPFEALGAEPLVNLSNVSYLNDLKFFDLPEVLRHTKKQVIAFAPDYKNTMEYSELNSTVKETELLKELFSAKIYEGPSALKNRFIENAPDYAVIHLAMHAISDSGNYENSSLVFDDGNRLTFDEISGLDIPAEMVVLSACNTANGKHLPGEGLMSLSRALTLAGSRSLLHTLWQIPDTESAEVMSNFYENLAKGMSKDEALAEAKRRFIRDNPLKRHPWYWAGFVLNGEAKPLEIEKTKGFGVWYVLALLVLLILIYFIRRRSSSAFSLSEKSV